MSQELYIDYLVPVTNNPQVSNYYLLFTEQEAKHPNLSNLPKTFPRLSH